jgi:hypothetical protein
VKYSSIVPFDNFSKLKRLIEVRKRWWHNSGKTAHFERQWNPSKWTQSARCVFVRQKSKVQYKDPVQLELFVPIVWDYDFRVIVINKRMRAGNLLTFHNGPDSHECAPSELNADKQIKHVPTRMLSGNQIYLLSAVLAHNLSPELQMKSMVGYERFLYLSELDKAA